MKNAYLKVLGVVVVVLILVFSIFAFTTQKEIAEINEVIEEIEEQPLSVRILSDASSGTSPLIVSFKPMVLNSKNEVEYYWEFGDGNTSTEQNPTHVYETDETYNIYNCKLTIKEGNTTMSDNYNVTIFPNNPPKIKILCKNTAFRPEKLSFNAEVFDPEGEELQYQWTLKHPLIMGGYQHTETFTTESFSKLFIRNGRYVIELTVTDESGNKVTDYEIFEVKVSRAEGFVNSLIIAYTLTLPGQLDLIWNGLNGIIGLEDYIDNNWLDMSPQVQNIINAIIRLSAGRIKYEPPIPKADLLVSEITDLNLSTYVNDTTGEVAAGAEVSSSFTIINNDTINTARTVYVSLEKPFSEDEGLDDVIEVPELTVGLDVGIMSNKMFYNGEYTNWQSCYNIEKLAPGDLTNLGITVTLKEGATFTKGTYQCTLYLYQEKHLPRAEVVDEIPFTITL
jgi:hypothetical protein